MIYLEIYQLRKTLLDKYLASRVSEHLSTDNIGNGPKHSCNLNDSASIIFINHCEGNYVGESLF